MYLPNIFVHFYYIVILLHTGIGFFSYYSQVANIFPVFDRKLDFVITIIFKSNVEALLMALKQSKKEVIILNANNDANTIMKLLSITF